MLGGSGFAAQIEKKADIELREMVHGFNTSYQVGGIHSLHRDGKANLQTLQVEGSFAFTPVFGIGARLPITTLANEASFNNPYIGLEGVIFDGLVKDFPTFAFLRGGIKIPLQSDHEFVFNRTDVILNFSTLREVQHLSLTTDTSYIIKVDSDPSTEAYGNEWQTTLGGRIDTGYKVSMGSDLNYRRSGQYKTKLETISGRSLLILKPTLSFDYDYSTSLVASWAAPLTRVNLRDTLRSFGDYTIPGVGGSTFFVSLQKKF